MFWLRNKKKHFFGKGLRKDMRRHSETVVAELSMLVSTITTVYDFHLSSTIWLDGNNNFNSQLF